VVLDPVTVDPQIAVTFTSDLQTGPHQGGAIDCHLTISVEEQAAADHHIQRTAIASSQPASGNRSWVDFNRFVAVELQTAADLDIQQARVFSFVPGQSLPGD
jgi:hypothetical protein